MRHTGPMNAQSLSGWHAVEAGQQPLSWQLWASDVDRSTTLTPIGRDVVGNAIDIIAGFLGKDWLHRFLPKKPHTARDDGLPLMDLSWWPANDVDHVHSRLLTFAARLELLRPCPGFAQVRRDMRADLGHFAHGVLQFEAGALALRDGWSVTLEPKVTSRDEGRADLRIERSGTAMLIETRRFLLDKHATRDLRYTQRLHTALLHLEMTYNVHVAVDLDSCDDPDELQTWIDELTHTAQQVAESGRSQPCPAPFGGTLTIHPGPPPNGTAHSMPIRHGDERLRIEDAITKKATQGASDTELWLRFDETSEFWNLHVPPAPHAVPWLADLAERAQRVMRDHPHVAGLVLSAPPGLSPPRPTLEAGLITTGATLLDSTAGTTLRRHMLLVPRDRHDAPTLTHWLDWYRTESDWLSWGLEHLGRPPLTELFVKPPL